MYVGLCEEWLKISWTQVVKQTSVQKQEPWIRIVIRIITLIWSICSRSRVSFRILD